MLEDQGSLINVQKKEAFDKISTITAGKVVKLPYTVYLPFGVYVANGVEFEIIEGEDVPEVPIWLHPAQSQGISPWYYVGGGVAAAAVTATVVMLLVPGEEEPSNEPAGPPTQTVQFGDIRFNKSNKNLSSSGIRQSR